MDAAKGLIKLSRAETQYSWATPIPPTNILLLSAPDGVPNVAQHMPLVPLSHEVAVKHTTELHKKATSDAPNQAPTSSKYIPAVQSLDGVSKPVWLADARLKWWKIVSEVDIQLLDILRGTKALKGKKRTKKSAHEEIVTWLLRTDVEDYPTPYVATLEQVTNLYASLKESHVNYKTKPSGSAAGSPPPVVFQGFWKSYDSIMSGNVTLNPPIRSDVDGVVILDKLDTSLTQPPPEISDSRKRSAPFSPSTAKSEKSDSDIEEVDPRPKRNKSSKKEIVQSVFELTTQEAEENRKYRAQEIEFKNKFLEQFTLFTGRRLRLSNICEKIKYLIPT